VLTLATLPAITVEFFAFWFGLGAGTYLDDSATGALRVVRRIYLALHDLLMLVARMVSRVREFAADRGSAQLTGQPEQLMSALQKISDGIARIPREDLRQPDSLQAFLVVPVGARRRALALLDDHPPLEQRLAALAKLARGWVARPPRLPAP